MAGFDRIKPPEERLRQRQTKSAADPEGRDAVFTGGDPDVVLETPLPESKFRAAPPPDPRDTPPAETASSRVEDQVDEPQPRVSSGTAPTDEDASRAGDGRAEPSVDDGSRSLLNVECQHCGVTAPMPLGTAVRRALPLAVINPLRSHPVFATCPCGERRAWLKPTLRLPR